jgi:uncharacterized membrane protein
MPQEDPIKLWQHLHGATIHFALALALVSAAFDLGSKLFGKKEWRTVGFWSLVVAVVLSVPAVLSGLWGQLGWFKMDKWEADHLLSHRNIALIGSGALLALLLWRTLTADFGNGRTGLDRRGQRDYTIYLVLVLLAAGAMGYTGFLGGYVARGY